MPSRIYGLDLARFFAFVGMVIVNFKVAMNSNEGMESWLTNLTSLLDGKAAATFVILAGIGISLASQKLGKGVLLKRGLFLFIIGILNTLIFEADILHYYGVYLALSTIFLFKSNKTLIWSAILISFLFSALLIVLDYSAGWKWESLKYLDFWTINGFIRNLIYNGFHPVIPWMAFLLLGMWLGRKELANFDLQRKLLFIGFSVAVTTEVLSRVLILSIAGLTNELDLETVKAFIGTEPMPPNLFYITTASGFAVGSISLCLLIAETFKESKVLIPFLETGRQTLTLYIAHILLGMGVLESIGLLENQTLNFALVSALIFCIIAVLFSHIWFKFFKRGPIEIIMRKITG